MASDKIFSIPQENRSNPVCTDCDSIGWGTAGKENSTCDYALYGFSGELVIMGFKQQTGDKNIDFTRWTWVLADNEKAYQNATFTPG